MANAKRVRDIEDFRKVLRDEIAGAAVFKGSFTPDEFHSLARKIMGAATKLERVAIDECNRPQTPADLATKAKAVAALDIVADEYGIRFDYHGDPRGYVVKLYTPHTKRYNTMGGAESGWGVPTRYS